MKLKAIFNELECEIELLSTVGKVVAEIDGRNYQLNVKEFSDGRYLFCDGARVCECHVTPQPPARDSFDVAIRGRNYAITIIDPRKLRAGRDSDHHHHGTAEITAPMAGKVVRVLIEVGQEVEASAGLASCEGTKMEEEVTS